MEEYKCLICGSTTSGCTPDECLPTSNLELENNG